MILGIVIFLVAFCWATFVVKVAEERDWSPRRRWTYLIVGCLVIGLLL